MSDGGTSPVVFCGRGLKYPSIRSGYALLCEMTLSSLPPPTFLLPIKATVNTEEEEGGDTTRGGESKREKVLASVPEFETRKEGKKKKKKNEI